MSWICRCLLVAFAIDACIVEAPGGASRSARMACKPRKSHGYPLQHQALSRLRRLLAAICFQNPDCCLRVALIVRVLHEGF